MKITRPIILVVIGASLLSTALLLQSCTKQVVRIPTQPLASLNVVNALPTSTPLILVQGSTAPVKSYIIPGDPSSGSSRNFTNVGALSYASIAVLSPNAGSDTLYAVQQNTDTSTIGGKVPIFMFNGVLNLSAGGLYSLFITGKDTTAPDYLLVRDTVPLHTDSTTGIRFVNLSTNSSPVSVDIRGQANGSEVSSLSYKAITGFKSYAATSAISRYTFEFRDMASGNLLASYTLTGVNTIAPTIPNTVLFRNLTIALIGQPSGGTVPQQCILINSF